MTMVTKELITYIRDQLQLSVGEIIRENLRSHGWKEDDIDDAFRTALLETPYTAAPMPKKRFHKKLILIGIFLFLLLFIPLSFGFYSYYFLPDSPIHAFFKQGQTVGDQKPIPTPTMSTLTPTASLDAPSEGFSNVFVKVRDNQRKSDLSKITAALEAYMVVNNSYPTSLDNLVPDDLSAVPKDPKTDVAYEYTQKKNGQDYELCAEFESGGRKCVSATVKVSDLP